MDVGRIAVPPNRSDWISYVLEFYVYLFPNPMKLSASFGQFKMCLANNISCNRRIFDNIGEEALILTSYLEFDTRIGDVIDITEKTAAEIRESGLQTGIAVVFVPGATGAVTTIEHEPGLVEDIRTALERLAPEQNEYSHDQKWGDGNGHSHIRASFIGPSLTVPFQNGQLMLGTWQQIVFLELDNRPRKRRIILQMLGE